MHFSKRKGSAVGFDMALEKVFNKTAKIVGGIIGFTARKEAVALWNITKHENDLHVAALENWCGMNSEKDSELDLHHAFTSSNAARSNS